MTQKQKYVTLLSNLGKENRGLRQFSWTSFRHSIAIVSQTGQGARKLRAVFEQIDSNFTAQKFKGEMSLVLNSKTCKYPYMKRKKNLH